MWVETVGGGGGGGGGGGEGIHLKNCFSIFYKLNNRKCFQPISFNQLHTHAV